MSELPIAGSYRPTVMGMEGVVASGHYLASLAAQRILDRGGNAIDAGVAAGLCTCVLQIDMVDLAGVAPIIIYLAEEDRVVTISGLGRWPQAASVAYFQKHHGGRIPVGVERCITPGSTRCLDYGAGKVWHDEPGGRHGGRHHAGRAGFSDAPLHGWQPEGRRRADASVGQQCGNLPAGGRPPEPGEVFVQRDLGRTMRRLVAAEASARNRGRAAGLQAARDVFYRGDIAREIAAFYASQGGLLTYDDLASFHAQIEAPVRVSFHEYDIYTCGPWCQGPVLAQVLALLAGYDLQALGHNSPAYVHLLTEALKLTFADRERYYGDPEFVDVPDAGPVIRGVRRRAPATDPARQSPAWYATGRRDPGHGNGAAVPWHGLQSHAENQP